MVSDGCVVWTGLFFLFVRNVFTLLWNEEYTIGQYNLWPSSFKNMIHFIPCISLAHDFVVYVAALWHRMVCMGLERRHQGLAWSMWTLYLIFWNLLIITGGAQLVLWVLWSFWSRIRACMPLSHRFFYIFVSRLTFLSHDCYKLTSMDKDYLYLFVKYYRKLHLLQKTCMKKDCRQLKLLGILL
jgi:hypothetical protein